MMSEHSESISVAEGTKLGGGKSLRDYKKREKKDCGYFFSKLDYEILRPLLIYKYEREEMHRQDEFIDMIMSDNNIIASAYSKVDHH